MVDNWSISKTVAPSDGTEVKTTEVGVPKLRNNNHGRTHQGDRKKGETTGLNRSQTEAILQGGNVETIERHLDALRRLSKEVDTLKIQVEQAKISNGDALEDAIAWSSKVEVKLASIDEGVVFGGKRLTDITREASYASKAIEEAALNQQRKEQLEFERMQLELKLEYDKKTSDVNRDKKSNSKGDKAKIPKLTITKFNGTYEAWLPFWNKFSVEVDSTDLAPVKKFAYLKELVDPKVRAEINGLHFSSEGYECAKNILKSEYGKESEIINTYISNIMGLPVITGSNPKKVDDFYKKLLFNVQSMETLGRLRDMTGNVRAVLEKLKGIKGDLVRGQNGWQEWDFFFAQMIQALKRWREIYPVEDDESSNSHTRAKSFHAHEPRAKSFHAHERVCGCAYCDSNEHREIDCTKYVTLDEQKKLLSIKCLCFNCAAGKHRAANCKSRQVCQNSGQRHHTSICDRRAQLLTATCSSHNAIVYPVIIVEVEGVKCRALLDTAAGSSYASATLLDCWCETWKNDKCEISK